MFSVLHLWEQYFFFLTFGWFPRFQQYDHYSDVTPLDSVRHWHSEVFRPSEPGARLCHCCQRPDSAAVLVMQARTVTNTATFSIKKTVLPSSKKHIYRTISSVTFNVFQLW